MKDTLYAIFENGLFRPLKKLSIPEGRKIRLTVETQREDDDFPSFPPEVSAEDASEGEDGLPPYMKVREALKGCSGTLSEDIRADREDRL